MRLTHCDSDLRVAVREALGRCNIDGGGKKTSNVATAASTAPASLSADERTVNSRARAGRADRRVRVAGGREMNQRARGSGDGSAQEGRALGRREPPPRPGVDALHEFVPCAAAVAFADQ